MWETTREPTCRHQLSVGEGSSMRVEWGKVEGKGRVTDEHAQEGDYGFLGGVFLLLELC